MTMVAVVVLVGGLGLGAALSISHWDLEGANRTCDSRASCPDTPPKRDRMADPTAWKERNCLCDELCSRYGDCCPDSGHFDVGEQRRGAALFRCVELRQFGGVYMRAGCPPDWSGPRHACEGGGSGGGGGGPAGARDPVSLLPATSHQTGLTYPNLHCALCHREADLDVWHPRLECPTLPHDHLRRPDIFQKLEWNATESHWGLRYEDRWHRCTVDPVIPETADHIVRRCPTDVIKTCAVNWTNAEVRARCEAYTSLVYFGSDTYRNPHCAVCNNIPLQYLRCTQIVMWRGGYGKDFSPVAFSVLFDLSGGSAVGKFQPCADDELFDPFFKRCRAVLTELREENTEEGESEEAEEGPYEPLAETSGIENVTAASPSPACPKFLLERTEYRVDNDTSVYVPVYDRTFGREEYSLREDGSLEICALGVRLVDKFGAYMGYVTFAGLGVSVVFLLLHLAAFALVPELRNLSGKNLASLCAALLVGYSAFMAGQVAEGAACSAAAALAHYSFLAAFSWTLTMSFDVWRTLRLATSELRVSAGKQWRKFAVYSAWSWLAPGVAAAGALLADTAAPDSPAARYRPDFGVHSCWFGRPAALWIFFAAPAAVMMAADAVFFAASARMIYSARSTTRFTASAGTRRDFALYARLAVVMGLTWIVGLVAGTLDYHILWYVFVLLNTLQGMFIFLAFTCTDKVIRGLALRRKDSKPLRPPSFSWSSDSTRKSHMGSDHGTTDTLY